jgi:hypothetical protein
MANLTYIRNYTLTPDTGAKLDPYPNPCAIIFQGQNVANQPFFSIANSKEEVERLVPFSFQGGFILYLERLSDSVWVAQHSTSPQFVTVIATAERET